MGTKINSKFRTAKFRFLASVPALTLSFAVCTVAVFLLDIAFQQLFPGARNSYSPIRPVLVPFLITVTGLAFFRASIPTVHLPTSPDVVLHDAELHRIESLLADRTDTNHAITPWSLQLLQDTTANVASTSMTASISSSGKMQVNIGYLLLKCLTSDEALTILLHKIGHAVMGHCQTSAWVSVAQPSWSQWHDVTYGSAESDLIPDLSPIKKVYYQLLSRAFLEHRRASEYEADAFAAHLAGRELTVRTLVLASAITSGEFPIRLGVATRTTLLNVGHVPEWPNSNPSLLLHVTPEHLERNLRTQWEERGRDTHPSLGERIRAIFPKMTLAEALSLANCSDRKHLQPAAAMWFDNPEDVQERVNRSFCKSYREALNKHS